MKRHEPRVKASANLRGLSATGDELRSRRGLLTHGEEEEGDAEAGHAAEAARDEAEESG